MNYFKIVRNVVDMTDRTMRLLAIRGILQKLDPANYAVLKFIITHLNRLVHQARNVQFC
jgi:RhoGAP domain